MYGSQLAVVAAVFEAGAGDPGPLGPRGCLRNGFTIRGDGDAGERPGLVRMVRMGVYVAMGAVEH